MRTFQWPRSDVLAFLSLVATAIGTLVAVFAFPELHDIIFGSTAAPLAPRPPETEKLDHARARDCHQRRMSKGF